MVANIQSSVKISSYPTGAADPKPMIPWPYKKSLKMRPVLVSIISKFLEVVDLSINWANWIVSWQFVT